MVNEVSADWVIWRVVPGGKYLLAKEQSPWSIPPLCTHFLGVLFTLRDRIHHMVTTTAQGGDLWGEEVSVGW